MKKRYKPPIPTTNTNLKSPCFACKYEKGLLLKQYSSRYALKCGRCGTYQYSVDILKNGEVCDVTK